MEENFDRLRLQLFQESAVYDSLLDNEMFPEFSNSFLLLIGKEEQKPEIVYSKFSNERDQRFAIRTDICEPGRFARHVKKLPAVSSAMPHIKNLEYIQRELNSLYEKEGLELNNCHFEKDGAVLEYLEGVTLEERLDELLSQGKTEDLEELFFFYLKKIRSLHEKTKFEKTPEFIKVFGDAPLEDKNYVASGMSNIDLVPANLLIQKDRQVVIDYEWTFRFPIPAKFIQYRMIHYYLETDSKRHVLKERDFYGKAGISEEDQAVFAEMERNFQKYMQGNHVPLLAMYEDVSPGKVEVLSYYEQRRLACAERRLQVFADCGKDFREEDSLLYPMSRFGVSMEMEIPENAERLRLDPGEAEGGLMVKRLVFEDGEAAAFSTNGFPIGENAWYFGAGDPQLVISNLRGKKKLQIEIEIMKEKEAREAFWQSFSTASAQKDEEIHSLKNRIRQMENTKIWKLYRSIRKK